MRDYNNFIFLDNRVRGEVGKAVYIDPGLLPRFVDLINTGASLGRGIAQTMGYLGDPEQFIKKLEELKSTVSGLTSDSCITEAGKHRQPIGNVEVSYVVLQDDGAKNRGAGVYITDLKRINAGNNSKDLPAGFYQSKWRDGSWDLSPIKKDETIPTVIGAIGASFDGIKYDAELTANRFGGYLAGNNGVNQQQLNNSFSLYYAPSYIVDELGVWQTSAQKIAGPNAGPVKLAQLLYKTIPWDDRDDTIKHHWYVFGEGAKMLSRALKEFRQLAGGKKLQQHCFYLVDPHENLGLLKREMDSVGAQTKKTSYKATKGQIASQMHQIKDADGTLQALQKMDQPWTNFDKIADPLHDFYQNHHILGSNKDRTFSEAVRYIRNNLKDLDEGWKR